MLLLDLPDRVDGGLLLLLMCVDVDGGARHAGDLQRV
jgi:hypothetical protein